jgi:hypothetical protein
MNFLSVAAIFPCQAALAAAIRRKNKVAMVRGLPAEVSVEVMLGHLDEIAKQTGQVPYGPLPGVEEPSLRTDMFDGSVPPDSASSGAGGGGGEGGDTSQQAE